MSEPFPREEITKGALPVHPSILPVQRATPNSDDYVPRSPVPPPYPEELMHPKPVARQTAQTPPAPQTNRLAVVGLLTSFVPVLGLVLSFLGLRKAAVVGVGAKIAKTGIALSLVLPVVLFLIVQYAGSQPAPPCSCDPATGYTPQVVSVIQ